MDSYTPTAADLAYSDAQLARRDGQHLKDRVDEMESVLKPLLRSMLAIEMLHRDHPDAQRLIAWLNKH